MQTTTKATSATTTTPANPELLALFTRASKSIGAFTDDLLEDLADNRLTTTELLGLGLKLPNAIQGIREIYENRKAWKRLTTDEKEAVISALAQEINVETSRAAEIVNALFDYAAKTVANTERQIKQTRVLVATLKKKG